MSACLSHGFLYVTDLDAQLAFYTRVLGFRPLAPPEDGFVRLVHSDGAGLALHVLPEGIEPTSPERRQESLYKLAYRTDDVQALSRSIVAAGGSAGEPWCRNHHDFCECTDPEGNPLQIFADRLDPHGHC